VRILWHSNSPKMPGGYGVQTALNCRLLRELGHEVVISSYGGGAFQVPDTWDGFTVLPTGERNFGNGVVGWHARNIGADLVILLHDPWVFEPTQFDGLAVMPWMPADTERQSALDAEWLRLMTECGARMFPIAMSRHGQAQLAVRGVDVPFVPHCVDTRLFAPLGDRAAWRKEQGIPESAFLIGMNANNKGTPSRKAFAEQFYAFAQFRKWHPNAFLLVHAMTRSIDGLFLDVIAADLGITGSVSFCDPTLYETGAYTQEYLAAWYGTLDLLTNCSLAEGFGIPIIEAMACGTPVAATRGSAMTELVPRGTGFLAQSQPHWNNTHSSWWRAPIIADIERIYERAYTIAGGMRQAARVNALRYDVKAVAENWRDALENLA
jgi:glycosyltransferase involved in cell wall biosynthesis